MKNDDRSDEAKRESDPKDGIETKEALTDQQIASIAAGLQQQQLQLDLKRTMLEPDKL